MAAAWLLHTRVARAEAGEHASQELGVGRAASGREAGGCCSQQDLQCEAVHWGGLGEEVMLVGVAPSGTCKPHRA